MLSLRRLKKSLKYARQGLSQVIQQEQNFSIELFIALVVVSLAAWLRFSLIKWAILLLTIGLVLLAELFNSVVERISDLLKPRLDLSVKEIKDIMAAAVFLASLLAIIIGLLLFIPSLLDFFIQNFNKNI